MAVGAAWLVCIALPGAARANTAPHCNSDRTVHTRPGAGIGLPVYCMDSESGSRDLAYTVTVAPTDGTLSGRASDGTLTYTPDQGFTGEDRVEIEASDGEMADDQAFVIRVADTPICAQPPAISVRAGFFARTADLGCSWPKSDASMLRDTIVTAPSQGRVDLNWSSDGVYWKYTADPDAHGADSFSYTFTDYTNDETSPVYTVAVETGPDVDQSPDCSRLKVPQVVYSARDTTLATPCEDAENDRIVYRGDGQPGHGTATYTDGGGATQIRYRAQDGYTGGDEVPFVADDGHGGTTHGRIAVDVRAPEVPTCDPDYSGAVTIRPGTSILIGVSCANPQGDAQSYSATTPTYGTLSAFAPDGSATYTARPDAVGTDVLDLRATDAVGTSAPTRITIHVDPGENHTPWCISPLVNVPAGSSRDIDIRASCRDEDGDAMTLTHGLPEHGTLTETGTPDVLRYTPDPGFTGRDGFSIDVIDTRGASSRTMAGIDVDPVAPSADPPPDPAPVDPLPPDAAPVGSPASTPPSASDAPPAPSEARAAELQRAEPWIDPPVPMPDASAPAALPVMPQRHAVRASVLPHRIAAVRIRGLGVRTSCATAETVTIAVRRVAGATTKPFGTLRTRCDARARAHYVRPTAAARRALLAAHAMHLVVRVSSPAATTLARTVNLR